MSVGEMVKEIFQARRDKVKDIQPRIDRHGSYIALRAATNVLLRDLQTNIVLDKMMAGVNSIYVDYLDYDEVAHHAGMARPESLDSLVGLDNVAGVILKARQYAPRPYHVVFLSDHGQSQGQTFRQMHDGKTLEDTVAELVGSDKILAATKPVEDHSAHRSLLSAKPFRLIKRHLDKESSPDKASDSEIVVTGSGNLGNIWFKHYQQRPTRDQIEDNYPLLIDKLLETKGIGLVIVQDVHGPVVIGRHGELDLKTGKATGKNPLQPYGPIGHEALYKVASMDNAPDLQIISTIDKHLGDVHAFEELVGNHGGIGGWQTEAFLMHPKVLKTSAGKITDSTEVHKILVGWLKDAGHRRK